MTFCPDHPDRTGVERIVFGTTSHRCAECWSTIDRNVETNARRRRDSGIRAYSRQVGRYSR